MKSPNIHAHALHPTIEQFWKRLAWIINAVKVGNDGHRVLCMFHCLCATLYYNCAYVKGVGLRSRLLKLFRLGSRIFRLVIASSSRKIRLAFPNSGVVAGRARGNCAPPPQFWAVGKLLNFFSCRKIFVQKCNIWGRKPPFCKKCKGIIKLMSTHYILCRKNASFHASCCSNSRRHRCFHT